MASEPVLQTFFKSEQYADSFKRGELVTYVFAKSLVEQSKLITTSKIHPNAPLAVLDNACGTGAVSSILNETLDVETKKHWKLTCGDISSAVLKYTERRMQDENWQNSETKLVDAQSPQLPSAFYDYVFTAFAYMALPQSIRGLDETVRMLKPGGRIAFSTWMEPGWMSVARRAIQSMPGNLPFPESKDILATLSDGEWHSLTWIKSQLEKRGFEDIEVRVETASIALRSSVFVDMSMLMLPMMIKSFWSEEQREANEHKIRPALVAYVDENYSSDGEVETDWVAIISTGRKFR
ncbi:hypothetical protein N7452_002083 [Penicillium brevicompactum]|uniref:Methyltransferase domain-containing protein n=1 Tax=Penicillium brevicompactum TaxID=5074 RepID=A0A9W9UQS3_PENBR|nr:hypothetical protein N7452_002083 [Penicillium brevicompactum]